MTKRQYAETAVCCAEHPPPPRMNVSKYTAYLGVYQLSDLDNAVLRGVKNITVHPDYMYEGSSGDIALIELEEPIVFTPSIQPVCLPSQDVPLPMGTMCWVTGWGNIKENTPLEDPQTLQKAEVGLINRTSCEAMYQSSLGYRPSIHLIQDDMICAGYKQGKIDACQGDSGGPLVCNTSNTWLQFGIVSWGLGCAEPNQPGVYTNVQYYLTWIQELVPSVMFCDGEPSIATTTFTDLSQSVSISSDLDGAFRENLKNRAHTQSWSLVTIALSLICLCNGLLL
ncbi:hypothetical protein XENTR_v10023410 [Xenopus tropicalis]|nr:hypothetical protein XENTR_v10023410 [Xenopus tropicalis]